MLPQKIGPAKAVVSAPRAIQKGPLRKLAHAAPSRLRKPPHHGPWVLVYVARTGEFASGLAPSPSQARVPQRIQPWQCV